MGLFKDAFSTRLEWIQRSEAFAGREDAAAKIEEAIKVIVDRVGAILSDPERWKESKMAEKIVAEL